MLNVFLALFIILTWASAFPLITIGIKELGALGLPALRFFISALVAAIYLAVTRPRFPTNKQCFILFIAAFFNYFLYQALLNYGQLYVYSGLASFIVNTNPLCVILFAVFFLNEKPGKFLYLGAFLALCGLILIAFSKGVSGAEVNIYVMIIALAGICAAIGNILQKPILNTNTSIVVTCLGCIFGGVFFLPFVFEAFEKYPTASPLTQWGVIYLGIFPAFLATAAFVHLMKEWGAARSTSVIFAVPPFALLFGFIFLNETPSALALLGASFTLTGVYLAIKKA